MDLARKIDFASQVIQSITTHNDINSPVRIAALEKLKVTLDTKIAAIHANDQAEIAATITASVSQL